VYYAHIDEFSAMPDEFAMTKDTAGSFLAQTIRVNIRKVLPSIELPGKVRPYLPRNVVDAVAESCGR